MADGVGESLSFLLVRRDGLVALGVSYANCVVDAGGLRAAGPPATLTLTFQPQSFAETKVDAPVTTFKRSNVLYKTAMRNNRGLDRDRDGIAREKL